MEYEEPDDDGCYDCGGPLDEVGECPDCVEQDDEDDDACEECGGTCCGGEPSEPEEGDWVTEDHIVFREHGGKGVIRIPLGGPWQPAVQDHMDREQFWPSVWFLSDHGNYHLLRLSDG